MRVSTIAGGTFLSRGRARNESPYVHLSRSPSRRNPSLPINRHHAQGRALAEGAQDRVHAVQLQGMVRVEQAPHFLVIDAEPPGEIGGGTGPVRSTRAASATDRASSASQRARAATTSVRKKTDLLTKHIPSARILPQENCPQGSDVIPRKTPDIYGRP